MNGINYTVHVLKHLFNHRWATAKDMQHLFVRSNGKVCTMQNVYLCLSRMVDLGLLVKRRGGYKVREGFFPKFMS